MSDCVSPSEGALQRVMLASPSTRPKPLTRSGPNSQRQRKRGPVPDRVVGGARCPPDRWLHALDRFEGSLVKLTLVCSYEY